MTVVVHCCDSQYVQHDSALKPTLYPRDAEPTHSCTTCHASKTTNDIIQGTTTFVNFTVGLLALLVDVNVQLVICNVGLLLGCTANLYG